MRRRRGYCGSVNHITALAITVTSRHTHHITGRSTKKSLTDSTERPTDHIHESVQSLCKTHDLLTFRHPGPTWTEANMTTKAVC